MIISENFVHVNNPLYQNYKINTGNIKKELHCDINLEQDKQHDQRKYI